MKKASFLFALCAGWLMTACNVDYEVDWNNVSLYIYVADATGTDLVSTDYGVTLTYQDKVYAIGQKVAAAQTRACPPVFEGFYFERGSSYSGKSDAPNRLVFGELDGSADMEEDIVLTWPDGTTNTIHYSCSDHKNTRHPSCKRSWTLDGEKHEGSEFHFVKSKNSALSTFEKGRVWRFAICSLGPVFGNVTGYMTFTDMGAAEVDGQIYHVITDNTTGEDTTNEYLLREEGGKVYRHTADHKTETLVFDCNMKVGEKAPRGYALSSIETKEGCDSIERRHFIFEEAGDILAEYIEGVGYTDTELFFTDLTTGSAKILVSCQNAEGEYLYLSDTLQ